jgi:hypothetical protein
LEEQGLLTQGRDGPTGIIIILKSLPPGGFTLPVFPIAVWLPSPGDQQVWVITMVIWVKKIKKIHKIQTVHSYKTIQNSK